MAGCGRTPTLLWDSVAAEIGCDAVRPLPCVAGILPGSVQPIRIKYDIQRCNWQLNEVADQQH